MTQSTSIMFLSFFLACAALSSTTTSAFTAPSRPLALTTAARSTVSTRGVLYTSMNDKNTVEEQQTTATTDKEGEATNTPVTGVFVPPSKNAPEKQYGVPEVDFPEKVIAEKKDEKELSQTQKLMQKVKESGTAGIISYALWELGFWALSVPVCVIGYQKVTGHLPDLQNSEDLQKLGAEAFAFVNFARFAVPLRIGLALSTTPWIQENIVERFNMNKKGDDGEN